MKEIKRYDWERLYGREGMVMGNEGDYCYYDDVLSIITSLEQENKELQKQLEEAGNHIEKLLGWSQGETPIGTVLNADNFLSKLKEWS